MTFVNFPQGNGADENELYEKRSYSIYLSVFFETVDMICIVLCCWKLSGFSLWKVDEVGKRRPQVKNRQVILFSELCCAIRKVIRILSHLQFDSSFKLILYLIEEYFRMENW